MCSLLQFSVHILDQGQTTNQIILPQKDKIMYSNVNSSSNNINNEQGFFILNQTWNILYYFFRIFGVYPCVRDKENNGLKPRSTFCIWTQFIFTFLVITVICMAIPIFFVINFETSPENFLDTLMKIHFKSSVKSFVMICNLIIYPNLGWVCQLQLRNLAIGLCEFQTYCRNNALIVDNSEIKRKLKLSKLYMFLYMLLATMAGILFNTWFFQLDISMASKLILIFGQAISITHIILPMCYFLFIYMEIIAFLLIWCENITKIEVENILVKEAKKFIDGLNLIGIKFSYFLFWITVMSLLELISCSYFLFVALVDQENLATILSPLCATLGFSILLFGLCTLSEDIANKV